MEKIEAHNRALIRKAMAAFGDMGLLNEEIISRKDHGTILNITGDDALYAYLEEENVSCSQRGGGIRLSFHLYNTEDEIDAIVKILKSAPGIFKTPKK